MKKLVIIFLFLSSTTVIAEVWDLNYEVSNLHKGGASTLTRHFTPEVLYELANIQYKLSQQSGIYPIFLISTDNIVNAYAFKERGKKIILLTIPMIRSLQHDVDAVAAVIGHELAHLKLNHLFSGQMTNLVINLLELFARKEINSELSGTGQAVANVVTQLSADAAKGFYSREDEYEADAHGAQYMIAAGYNPEGAIRFHQTLNQSNSSFFSTHPTSNERISRIYALAGQGRNNQPAYNNYSSNISSRLPACSGTNVQSWSNCYGVATWPNGSKYEGEFGNGQPHGQGSGRLANGDIYVGQYRYGDPHGQGTYTWGAGQWAGDKYIGGYINNKRHGQGTYTFSNGVVQKGVFANDQFMYAR